MAGVDRYTVCRAALDEAVGNLLTNKANRCRRTTRRIRLGKRARYVLEERVVYAALAEFRTISHAFWDLFERVSMRAHWTDIREGSKCLLRSIIEPSGQTERKRERLSYTNTTYCLLCFALQCASTFAMCVMLCISFALHRLTNSNAC